MASAIDYVEAIHYAPGEFLFKEGEESYHFFMIQEGEVEITKQNPYSREKITIAVIGAGQSVGEFAMFDKKPRSATARALTSLIAVKVSEQGCEHLLDELPDWAHSMLQSLVERLRQTNEIVRRSGTFGDEIHKEIESLEHQTSAVDQAFGELGSRQPIKSR